jgi:acetyltransferase
MIHRTRVSRLLEGYRGKPAADVADLEKTLVKVSYLLVDFPEIVEMDINPLLVGPDGVSALDARIVIAPKEVRKLTVRGAHLMISVYPSKYYWEVPLDGEKVFIRAIRPEDAPLWTEMIDAFSPTAAAFRFSDPVGKVTREMVVRYCHIDYDREIALVALRAAAGKRPASMLGAARLTIERESSDEGEFAIAVRDDYQRTGIGSSLMDALIEAARDRHVREIVGHVKADNARMLRFAENLGFEVLPSHETDVRRVVLRL